MSDRNTIDHIGFVESVNDHIATIRINSQSACAACHAKGACTAADQSEKVLSVDTGGREVHPGEQVRVHISKRTGLRAVAYGYVYPFVLLLLLLIILTAAGGGPVVTGIACPLLPGHLPSQGAAGTNIYI